MKKIILLTSMLLLLTLKALAAEPDGSGKRPCEAEAYATVAVGSTTDLQMKEVLPLGAAMDVGAGLWFNPTFGMSIDGSLTLGNKDALQSHTAVTRAGFTLNGLVSLSSLLSSSSSARPLDVAFKAGLGYDFLFGHPANDDHANDRMVSNTGLLLSYRLTPRLQLTAQPLIHWTLTTGRRDDILFSSAHAETGLLLGVTYQLGTIRKAKSTRLTRRRRYHHQPVFKR